MISDFHFLRPWWLAALVPALLLLWAVHRRSDPAGPWKDIVAEHLRPWLIRGGRSDRRFGPLVLMAAAWLTVIVILAGPVWRRVPSPFADEVAPLVVVLKISPSMQTEDIQPSRLARSVQKIHDLLALRGASKAGLIAYAGTAHVVMPPTVDAGIVNTFAESLDPKIMPEEGDAAADALRLADRTLASAGGGSILWITDGIAPEQQTTLRAWRQASSTSVRVLAPLPESPELTALRDAASAPGAKVITLTPDDTDVSELDRASKAIAPAADLPGTGDETSRWQDSAYWLTPLAALLMLPFFRKGWMNPPAARI